MKEEKHYQAPIPPNTLRNADGTPYAAGHDEQSAGQIAYEAFVYAPGYREYRELLRQKVGVLAPSAHPRWEQLLPVEQQVWEEVAQAVLSSAK